MGGAYPYMDLNAKYGKLLLRFYYDFTAIDSNKDISKTRQVHVKSQLLNKMSDRKKIGSIQISDGYKSTMDWCSVYLAPQGLPKYIYLSPPLIFPTTYKGQKTARCESLRALLAYVEWDRFVTLTGEQSEWGLRYRIYAIKNSLILNFMHNIFNLSNQMLSYV